MNVLCAIDGSAGSDAAVRLVGQMLSPESDEVVFYYSPPRVSVRGASAVSSEIVEQAAEALVERVIAHARRILPAQLAERTTYVTGHQSPRHGIPAAAKLHRSDLIVVGARGTSRFGLPRLGSVSRSVVYSADVPVLVARARQRPEQKPLEILLCCDKMEMSKSEYSFLNQLSLPEDAVGRVVHVVESMFVHGLPEWLEAEARGAESDPIAKAYIHEHDVEIQTVKEEIASLAAGLPEAFRGSQPVVLEGHPGEQIVKLAESEQIDIVVLGAHIVHPLARMLAGSTSAYVLGHAACSVLIVPHHQTP